MSGPATTRRPPAARPELAQRRRCGRFSSLPVPAAGARHLRRLRPVPHGRRAVAELLRLGRGLRRPQLGRPRELRPDLHPGPGLLASGLRTASSGWPCRSSSRRPSGWPSQWRWTRSCVAAMPSEPLSTCRRSSPRSRWPRCGRGCTTRSSASSTPRWRRSGLEWLIQDWLGDPDIAICTASSWPTSGRRPEPPWCSSWPACRTCPRAQGGGPSGRRQPPAGRSAP